MSDKNTKTLIKSHLKPVNWQLLKTENTNTPNKTNDSCILSTTESKKAPKLEFLPVLRARVPSIKSKHEPAKTTIAPVKSAPKDINTLPTNTIIKPTTVTKFGVTPNLISNSEMGLSNIL